MNIEHIEDLKFIIRCKICKTFAIISYLSLNMQNLKCSFILERNIDQSSPG